MKWKLVLLLLLYIAIMAPNIGKLPMLDGNIEFLESYKIFTLGPFGYAREWSSVHPPLKGILVSIGFALLGVSPQTYTLVAILLGSVGVLAYWRASRQIAGAGAAMIATVLMTLAGPFAANSTMALRDSVAITFIYTALLMYHRKRWWLCGAALVAAWATKETMLIISLAILTVELLWYGYQKLKRQGTFPRSQLLMGSIVIALYPAWQRTVVAAGGQGWNETAAIFAPTAAKGPVYTMLQNTFTLGFLNDYAYTNWLNAFVLNWHWVYSLIAIAGVSVWIIKSIIGQSWKKTIVETNTEQKKIVAVMGLFFLVYVFVILGFQTWAIPRYALPVQTIVYLIAGATLWKLYARRQAIGICVGVVCATIAILGLTTSVDPVSTNVWGTMRVFGQTLYNTPSKKSGNDGITYNAQFLAIMAARDAVIHRANQTGGPVLSSDCYFTFPDPRIEAKVFAVLGFTRPVKGTLCQKGGG